MAYVKNDPEKFVKIWQGADTAEDAAKEYGRPVKQCSLYASTLRHMGVPLKKMRRGMALQKYDIATLRVLAKESLK